MALEVERSMTPERGLSVAGLELSRRRARAVLTRVLDVVGASAGLVVLSPVLLVAAIAIRATSRGPVFFRHARYGKDQRVIAVLKLRTMVHDHAAVIDLVSIEERERQGLLTKGKGDPRVTRVGRVLRRTSVDEIPQLVNVLRGDMALVGPRPLPPFMLDPYDALREVRCAVKPGLTGLWQINGREENTSAWSMAEHDLEYLATQSVTKDLAILVKTVPAVIRGDGAV